MFSLKPPGGLYTLPYLTDSLQDDVDILTRAEWWEVLFFIKKLEPKQQQEINNILRQNIDEQAMTVFLILVCKIGIEIQSSEYRLFYLVFN